MLELKLIHVDKKSVWQLSLGLLYPYLYIPFKDEEPTGVTCRYNKISRWIAVTRLNPYRAGTKLSRFNKVNIIAADALAPYIARTSTAMVLTM